MHLDRRLLGWGTFFILVGAIPLAVRANLLDVALVRTWPSLWPLLLIGWGIGLVLRRTPIEWLGGAVTAVTFGLMGGGALATGFGGVPTFGGCGGGAAGTAFETQSGTLAASGQLNVRFNCGTLAIATVEGAGWSVSGTAAGGRPPRVSTSGSTVTIESEGTTSFLQDDGQSSWTVSVPRTPSLGFGLTLNAGDGTADLAGANLSSVSVTLNAGALRVLLDRAEVLGDVNATVNAGDATLTLPAGDRSANLSLNAGNLEVCLPADAAVRVHWSGALGSNDLDQAGLTEVTDDTWVSAGFDESQSHLELRVSANAGSFGLQRGGTCDA